MKIIAAILLLSACASPSKKPVSPPHYDKTILVVIQTPPASPIAAIANLVTSIIKFAFP